uniref:SSD domain-containing protein n=1 Tax=Globodera pallida TaxID=36090 RepID=A0A183CKR3_GLOPA
MVLIVSRLVLSHPFLAILLSLLLSIAVPVTVLVLFPLQLGNNAEKGFETDGTPYSGPRLAWTLLQPSLLRGSRVPFTSAAEHLKGRWKRRSWTDELLSSVGLISCYNGPIPAMSFLSQFIITVPSLEHLFSGQILHKICQFQDELKPEWAAFHQLTPHRNIWSVPNYVACLTPANRVNCSFIDAEDVLKFHEHIQWAPNDANSGGQQCPDHSKAECAIVPAECDGQMWFDFFYRILPVDLSQRPLPINAFLPFYSFAAYRLQGISVPLKAFTDIEAKLNQISAKNEDFHLKGLSLEIKRDILLEAAVRDARFSVLAVLAVFLLLGLYSLSLTFALAVLFQLIASVLCSLAVYRIFSAELPLLNLIAFVLLISVGADGAFLLLDMFPATEKLCLDTLQQCLRHTAKTIAFGLFAGLTLMFNYLLLIIFLPSFLIIQNRHLNPWLIRWWPSRWWYCFPSSISQSSLNPPLHHTDLPFSPTSVPLAVRLPARMPSTWFERFHHFLRTLIDDVLTAVLIQGRFVWLCSLGIVLIVSAYVCATELSLPRYNPLQLFRSSNPHEYFDQAAFFH